MKALRRAGHRIIKFLGYQTVEGGLPPDFSAEVAHLVETVQPFTMTSPERICSLIKAVEYIVTNNIPGDIVECGVWKGGSMMAVRHTLLRLNRKDRALFLFDTFEGMPPATEVDRNFRGESATGLLQSQDRATSWIWGSSPLEEVRTNLKSIHYPFELINFVKGRVEDTIPSAAPDKISLLRLDTDWYESTKHELVHLFPRLSTGGVLIIDDYGHWEGARKAVDEYVQENYLRLLLCRIDYTGRIAVKQSSQEQM